DRRRHVPALAERASRADPVHAARSSCPGALDARARHARVGASAARAHVPRRSAVSTGRPLAGGAATPAHGREVMTDAVSVRRAHRMPFGAEAREDGTTRFRIWAPGARSVELVLEDPHRAFPVPRDAGGWAEFSTREAPPRSRYRFRIDGELLVPDPAS